MGGGANAASAENTPHRSSSPLKRKADAAHDAEMPSSDHPDESHTRSMSVDMLANEEPPVSRVDQIPSIDEQIKVVTTLCEADAQKQLQDNDSTYVVSKRWLARVEARSSHAKGVLVNADEPIGPVDNSDIIQDIIRDVNGVEFVRLKPGLGEESFQCLPEDAWKLVVEWYGLPAGAKPIVRTAHNTNTDKDGLPNIIYEWHPLVLTIHRLWSRHSGIPIPDSLKTELAPVCVVSRSSSYVEFLRHARKAINVDMTRKMRIWRIPAKLPATAPSQTTPPASRDHSPAEPADDTWANLLLDVETFVALEKGVQRELLVVDKNTTRSTLAFIGLGADEDIVVEEHVQGEDFVSTYTPKNKTATGRAAAQASSSGRSSPAPSGPVTRGRAQKSGRTLGCVGLSNLGNTCYMNSALQCVRNVEELTKYFLLGEAEDELNTDNPLGWGGNVALAYGALLREIFREPVPPSVAPRQFKNTIGRYAPSFSGYGQQDSQEFLGFLLDGLQEDLSRVKKKPYIEKPDSTDDMVNNPEAIREMAAKVWDITKRRDDSVVADLFTGMYKSTLVCPECNKVSITFDPFNNLTLQLPIESTWNHDVTFFPLNDIPVQIHIDMDKHGSIKALKQFITKKTGVPVERLVVAEDFKNVFYKLFSDFEPASEKIGPSDKICVYELADKPTNWPAPKKARHLYDDDVPDWDDPAADMMLVPVIHRRPVTEVTRYSSKPWSFALPPHFITVTKEEARNADIIRRKVLQKVATFSTHSIFVTESDDGSSDRADADMVVTTGSDADSSGDSKVAAHSVDGEEDVVDVTMKDAEASKVPEKSYSRPPTWVDSDEFLLPELQNAFQMGYFSGTKEVVPVGWNVVTEDKTFPSLTSRDENALKAAAHANGYSEKEIGSEEVSDASDEDEPTLSFENANTRMTEESDDETLAVENPKTEDVESDGGPLIRLGEGLIIDWDGNAFETLFDGEEGDPQRGMNCTTQPAFLADPELEAKQKARQLRRQRGITLEDCLDEFGKEEILSEMDTWYCPRCKEHRRASKKFELWKTPDIMIMHLKRFSSSGYHRNKLDVLVDFPLEGLDLSSRVIEKEDGKLEIFDLFAVDDHWGGLGGGHYTAFAKSFVDGEWYEYNDSSVSKQRDTSHIVSAGAYLLFYRRRSDVPLGGTRFQEIVQRYNNPPETSSDDEQSGSGEDQRLVADSSLRGSSSALTGVGAVHQAGGRSLDLGVGERVMTMASPSDGQPPAYHRQSLEEDGTPLLDLEQELNSGTAVRESVEADEGIDMSFNDNYSSNLGFGNAGWNFANLGRETKAMMPSATTSEVAGAGSSLDGLDGRSDFVQHDSSAGSEQLAQRLREFEEAEPEGGEFIDPSPVPDVDVDAQVDSIDLFKQTWHPASQADEQSDDAAEIHVEEGEGLRSS